jgi:hypothetical protein
MYLGASALLAAAVQAAQRSGWFHLLQAQAAGMQVATWSRLGPGTLAGPCRRCRRSSPHKTPLHAAASMAEKTMKH